MLDYITLQAFDVRFRLLTYASPHRGILLFNWQDAGHYLCQILTNERLHGDVEDEHLVVSDTVPERHNTGIGDVNVACHPEAIDWFASLEEGSACSPACLPQHCLL